MNDLSANRVAFGVYSGVSLAGASRAVDREFMPIAHDKQRMSDDLVSVDNTSELGSFIVLALVGKDDSSVGLVGALPVSIDQDTGVIRTRSAIDSRSYGPIVNRAHISYGLVHGALSHLVTIKGVDKVRVEAPHAIQDAYLPHGLAIGATTELAVVQPIKRVGLHAS